MNVFEYGSLDHPPESYSRELDNRVKIEEKPYGYVSPPPPADTGDYDQARLESKKQYAIKNGRAI